MRSQFASNAALHAASPPSRTLSAAKASKPRETSGETVPSWADEKDLVTSSHVGKADDPRAAIAADRNPKSASAEKREMSDRLLNVCTRVGVSRSVSGKRGRKNREEHNTDGFKTLLFIGTAGCVRNAALESLSSESLRRVFDDVVGLLIDLFELTMRPVNEAPDDVTLRG